MQETVAGAELDVAETQMFCFPLQVTTGTRVHLSEGQQESAQDIFTLKMSHSGLFCSENSKNG